MKQSRPERSGSGGWACDDCQRFAHHYPWEEGRTFDRGPWPQDVHQRPERRAALPPGRISWHFLPLTVSSSSCTEKNGYKVCVSTRKKNFKKKFNLNLSYFWSGSVFLSNLLRFKFCFLPFTQSKFGHHRVIFFLLRFDKIFKKKVVEEVPFTHIKFTLFHNKLPWEYWIVIYNFVCVIRLFVMQTLSYWSSIFKIIF